MTAFIEDMLEQILPTVAKPARYTGGELNAVIKDHAACDLKFAMAFPDSYEIGMSNLACSILYDIVNRRDDAVAERVYAPWPDMEQAMRDRGVPLYTLETKTPVREYDMIGFSLSYEMSYTNVLNMLDLAGMPVRSMDRDDDSYPLVIAGGHCTYNPEPIAPFVDLFVVGEGEEVLTEILDTFKANRHLPKVDLLVKLANLRGVYVPRFYEATYQESTDPAYVCADDRFVNADHRLLRAVTPLRHDVPALIERRIAQDLDALPYPTKPVVPYIEVVHDRISLEVMRGCTRGCRFCQAGMISRPIREKSPERLMQLADEMVRNTGHEDISLVSLSTTDHSCVERIVRDMIDAYGDKKIGVSLPSIRADRDCVKLAEEIQKVRKSGLTFAPEAGTQRMRDVVNKNVTEEDLFAAAETAFSSGWMRLKLYFMIALPTETDEDVVAIADLADRTCRLGRKMGVPSAQVAIGVSSFVPKPNTPFQWFGQDPLDEIERKQLLVRRSLKVRAVQFRGHDPHTTHMEAVFSLGDRRVADVVEHAWRHGQKFDAWNEHFHYDVWMQAFEQCGIDPYFYANRAKGYDEALPWDHISCGVTKQFLMREDKRAREAKPTPDCNGGPCTLCCACDRANSR